MKALYTNSFSPDMVNRGSDQTNPLKSQEKRSIYGIRSDPRHTGNC